MTRLLLILLLIISAPYAAAKWRDDAVCNYSGECIVDIGRSAKNILLACETSKVSMQWSKKRQGAYLISCDCECTSHDNVGWLVDKHSTIEEQKVQKLYLGKDATIEALRAKPGIVSDIVASHAMCGMVDGKKLELSIFVSLVKRPTNDELMPYCFFPIYMVEGVGGLKIIANDTDVGGLTLTSMEDDPISRVEIIKFISGLPQ
jgi:hypothetical protein